MTRKKLSPEYKAVKALEKRRRVHTEMLAMQREASRAKREAGLTFHIGRHRESEAEQGWRRQLPLMPADTRDLTSRVCGDPLPGRSALDRRSLAGR